MKPFIKISLVVTSVAASSYGAFRLFKLCKKAYEDEIRELKDDIQNQINNIVALTKERDEDLMADQSALLDEARLQLIRVDPDIDTLRSLLNILKGTLNNMIQHRNQEAV